MKVIIQLQKLLKEEKPGRGIISEIAKATGLERHTVAALLKNDMKYVSLEAIGRICDFLVERKNVDPAILPQALFGKDHDAFLAMLANRKRLDFCLATRRHAEWPDNDYVMATDAHLHGALASLVSKLEVPLSAAANKVKDQHQRVFADPLLVPAPRRVKSKRSEHYVTRVEGAARAREIYATFQSEGKSSALITLGSVKVQGVLEVLLGDIFGAPPFRTQDNVLSPRNRRCPFYFRYRPHDPAPESLCGGTQLSKREAPDKPGIYYETEKKMEWVCCPCEPNKHDVAFVFYTYRPPSDELQLACGGFSGVATRFLAERFSNVASQFWPPQYQSDQLHVGLFLVAFDARKASRGKRATATNANDKFQIIPLHSKVLTRRLEP